mgnify:CR=1 FL=1
MAALPVERGFLSSPEELIDEARNGRMFILVDDEDRRHGAVRYPCYACYHDLPPTFPSRASRLHGDVPCHAPAAASPPVPPTLRPVPPGRSRTPSPGRPPERTGPPVPDVARGVMQA